MLNCVCFILQFLFYKKRNESADNMKIYTYSYVAIIKHTFAYFEQLNLHAESSHSNAPCDDSF